MHAYYGFITILLPTIDEKTPHIKNIRSMSIYEQKHNRCFNDTDYAFTALYVLPISTQNKSVISFLKYTRIAFLKKKKS